MRLFNNTLYYNQKMHRHANEAEMGLSDLANVTSLNDVLLTSSSDVFLQVVFFLN